MGSWWTIRRVLFMVFGWLLLGLAAYNASMLPADRRVAHFVGGSIWAVLCFAVALWPRREPGQRRPGPGGGRAEPSAAADPARDIASPDS